MNQKQIDCFIEAATRGSFHAAGEALFLSQPAVSYQIQALENELGFALFSRDRRRIALTPPGISFYRDCIHIRTLFNDAICRAQGMACSSGAVLTLASTNITDQLLLPELLQRHSTGGYAFGLNLKSTEDAPTGNIPRLFDGTADLVFCSGDDVEGSPNLCFEFLYTARSYCLMSRFHPLSSRPSIGYCDLNNQVVLRLPPMLTAPLHEGVFERVVNESELVDIRMVESHETMRTMTDAGLGIQFVPLSNRQAQMVDNRFVAIPFKTDDSLEIGVCWKKSSESPYLQQLVDLIREVFGESD